MLVTIAMFVTITSKIFCTVWSITFMNTYTNRKPLRLENYAGRNLT